MPKETKFRGKCIYPGRDGVEIFNKFIYGDLHKRGNEWFIYCNDLWFEVDKKTVGQYTGLKDKNGKEIYEGDIVECKCGNTGKTILRQVEYIGVSFCTKNGSFYNPKTKRREYSYVPLKPYVKVIGNIYEKPEILEGNSQ